MKKTLIFLSVILITITQFGCAPYEEGPYITLRTKLNRVAGKIGKQWKSEKYLLQIGQEGFALSIPSEPGFIDIGDWKFNDSGEILIFDSETFPNYEFRIVKLGSSAIILSGKFPYDNAAKEHEFECIKEIEKLN